MREQKMNRRNNAGRKASDARIPKRNYANEKMSD